MNYKHIRTTLWVAVAAVSVLWAAAALNNFLRLPPSLKPNFLLTDANGKATTLQNFSGKWVILVFGFTSCPDICAATLSKTSFALHQLGDDAKQIATLFINIDPQDTPQDVANWLKPYHPSIQALHGNADALQAAARSLGGDIEIGGFHQPTPQHTHPPKAELQTRPSSANSAARQHSEHRLFNHPSSLFLISPTGKLAAKLPFTATPPEWAEAIRKQLYGD